MMKKLRSLIVAFMAMMGMFANAATIVGAEDNSTLYLGAFSEILSLSDGQMATFEFTNYSAKGGNYQNWVTCVSGETFAANALSIALRADNWENVQDSNTGVSSNFNWDIFMDEMDGSSVVLTVKYQNGKVTIHADITAKSGNKYFEEFSKTGYTGTITTALSVDHSHLNVTKAEVGTAEAVPEGLVGALNNTSVYLGDFSEKLQLTDGQMATFEFTNYSAKGGNYQNWVTCVSGETFAADALSIALRADNWENVQDSNTGISSNFNWDIFRDEMDGSSVVLTVKYQNGKVTIHADITAKSGNKYFEEFSKTGYTGTITTALSVDHSHLIVTKAKVSSLETAPEGLVGNESNTTSYLGDRSDVLELPDGKMATFEFTNYSPKDLNWHNWVACVSNSETVAVENMIIALRADNYELVQGANTGIYSNFNWDTFLNDMDKAKVVVTMKNERSQISTFVKITAENGNTYFEKFAKASTGTVYAFITVDKSHIIMSKAEVTDLPAIPEGQVGYDDNTSIYLGDFSEVLSLTDGKMATFEFKNYSDEENPWFNWVTCIGGETFDAANLQVALRTDPYEVIQGSNSGITTDFNWDNVRTVLNGASVTVTVKYQDGKVVINVEATTNDNNTFSQTFTKESVTGTISAAMSVDHAHLIVSKAEVKDIITDGISAATIAKDDVNAPMFDLAGRRVDAGFKGIVIKNGKKMVVK